jgi:DNA-binding NtrC family response regulator
MSARRPNVLVVARASAAIASLLARLRAHGMEVAWARDDRGAVRALAAARFDAVALALRAPGIDGMALLRRARAEQPGACVVMMAAPPRRALDALREGAWDALPGPTDAGRLIAALERGLEQRRLTARLAALEAATAAPAEADPFIGGSRAIARVAEQLRHLASTQAAVLIEGETGTGKEAAARAIHRSGPRREAPFVRLECAGGASGAFERALFGVEGPADAAPAALERAAGGTLYLDEIAAAPEPAQARLLRLLQERAYERDGGRATLRADVRLIAGTARDLGARVREGAFREDLYRRLAVARIALPPLRERREDIPALVARFLQDANRRHRRRVTSVTRGVLERLTRHAWPGNVRELRDTIEAMLVASPAGRPLDLAALPAALGAGAGERERLEIAPGMTVDEAERALIAVTLSHVGHDKPRAAGMLGIGLRTLYRKIKEYGLG